MNQPVMMEPIAVIGSITRDRIYFGSQSKPIEQTGGGVYYAARTLAAVGARVLAYPLLAPVDATLLDAFGDPLIELHPIWTQETTCFELRYSSESHDEREETIRSHASSVMPESDLLGSLNFVKGIHVAPLLPDEFDLSFYARLRTLFDGMISLDGQGLIRGEVPDLSKVLKNNIDILKVDEKEMQTLSGESEDAKAADRFSAWGIRELVITKGSRGAVIFEKGGRIEYPADPVNQVVDATGCGDTFAAIYIWQRINETSIEKAMGRAAYVAARNVEVRGALVGPVSLEVGSDTDVEPNR